MVPNPKSMSAHGYDDLTTPMKLDKNRDNEFVFSTHGSSVDLTQCSMTYNLKNYLIQLYLQFHDKNTRT